MLCRFFYDGRRVQDEDTPESLELEDGEFVFHPLRICCRSVVSMESTFRPAKPCYLSGDAIEVQLERECSTFESSQMMLIINRHSQRSAVNKSVAVFRHA